MTMNERKQKSKGKKLEINGFELCLSNLIYLFRDLRLVLSPVRCFWFSMFVTYEL